MGDERGGGLASVLVDLVLEQQGRYWRKRVALVVAPHRGQRVGLLDQPALVAVVVGTSTDEGGGDGGAGAAATAVLLRCNSTDGDQADRLHQAGWRSLL